MARGELRLSTDFFCFKHWYYYQDESGFVASNSYHLMLLALRELGLPSSGHPESLRHPGGERPYPVPELYPAHGRGGVFQLAPEQRLVLRDGAWSVERSYLGEIFPTPRPYHEEDYQALLDQAAGELVDNCRRILSDAHYEDISVDLSGGLDSRIVYSAMTNLPESAGRIKISTRDTPGSQDLPIALSINRLYGYPYDDFPVETCPLSPRAMDEMHRSFYLGVFYSYAPLRSAWTGNKRVSVTGGLGDAITRPHMGLHRRYLTSPMAHLSSAEAFTEDFRRELGPNLVLGGQEAARAFVSYLSRELEDMGQWDYFKGLNHMYLAYRNSYHFYGIGAAMNYHLALPIQSKALLRLSDMVFSVHRSIRMTLDLIYRLNPVAASFPLRQSGGPGGAGAAAAGADHGPLFPDAAHGPCTRPEAVGGGQQEAEGRGAVHSRAPAHGQRQARHGDGVFAVRVPQSDGALSRPVQRGGTGPVPSVHRHGAVRQTSGVLAQ